MTFYNSNMSILCIDASYFIFYRYYALTTWYNLAHPQQTTETDSKVTKVTMTKEHPDFDMFRQKFKKLFIENIQKLAKKFKATTIIVASDSPRASLWRCETCDTYKATRECKDPLIKEFFQLVNSEIYPTLDQEIANSQVYCLATDSAEADDIIAVVHNLIREKMGDKVEIVIIANDHDYFQLISEHTSLAPLRGKMFTHQNINAEDELLKKIICGDKSDNISPIGPKSKQILELVLTAKDRDQAIQNLSPTIKDAFYNNQKLISFDYIPSTLKKYNTKNNNSKN